MTAKKLLVIGSGSSLAKHFLSTQALLGWELYCTTSKHTASARQQFALDLEQGLQQHPLKSLEFDAAVVFAAKTNIADCEKNPNLAQKVNCDSVLSLIEELNVKQWILFSSNTVFAGEQPLSSKTADCSPVSVYGETKAAMEKAALVRSNVAIVRMTKVISPDFPLLTNFITQLRRGETIQVFDDLRFAPVWLDDVCQFVAELIKQFKPGLYHLSSNRDLSYYEAIQYCAARLGLSQESILPGKKHFVAPDYNSLALGDDERLLGFVAPTPEAVLDKYLLSIEKTE